MQDNKIYGRKGNLAYVIQSSTLSVTIWEMLRVVISILKSSARCMVTTKRAYKILLIQKDSYQEQNWKQSIFLLFYKTFLCYSLISASSSCLQISRSKLERRATKKLNGMGSGSAGVWKSWNLSVGGEENLGLIWRMFTKWLFGG